jgi:glycosyltransferase 2 family protein
VPNLSFVRGYGPLILGLGSVAALLVFVDAGSLASALEAFDLRLLPLLLALATTDYALRYLRWRLLVIEATGSKPPLLADIAIFLAANTLLLTPARAGDFTRSLWARDLFGTPIARTAPVPVLERVADVALMCLLAGAGALAFGAAEWTVAAILVAIPVLFAIKGLTLVRQTATWLDRLVTSRPGVASFIDTLRVLWRPRPLAIAAALGAAAWAIECLMFFVVLAGFGLDATPRLLAEAAFIYPVATLAGSLSLLPGGLGLAEASTAALTLSLTAADTSTALAAAVLIRLAIVGFGIATGLPGLVYVSRAHGPAHISTARSPSPAIAET